MDSYVDAYECMEFARGCLCISDRVICVLDHNKHHWRGRAEAGYNRQRIIHINRVTIQMIPFPEGVYDARSLLNQEIP